MVRRTRLPTHQQINGNTDLPDEYIGEGEDHMMVFDKDHTVDLYVPDVLPASAQPVQNDTEISARDTSSQRPRELQRWDAGGDSSINMSLEDSGSAGWDQFAVNERMYGVQSSYDENIYTTQINRNDPSYRQREAEAARIAREIEGSAPSNSHVAEERRRDAERGDGLDEEEKYSGVRRDSSNLPKRNPGSYVPPSQRPISNAPSVPGAPYDPAIISSQLAKPAPQAAPVQPTEAKRSVDSSQVGGEQITESTEAAVKEAQASVPAAPKKPAENTTEDHVRNVTDSFKQFANNEKLRIRQAQEAKRSTARAEKNVKLNDLKKFAANFKLKSRVPDDLVPILAKDREKQLEIQQKADEAAKEEASRAKEREKQKAAGAVSPALSSAASQVGTTVSFNQQHSRTRTSQNLRQPPLSASVQSPRQAMGAQQNRAYGGRSGFPPPPQPLPADLRIPTGPAVQPADPSPLSPISTTKLNVNARAFEFRPGVNNFTPSGTSPSPQRSTGSMEPATATESADFFKDKKAVDPKERKNLDECFNPIKRMLEAEYPDEQKKAFASNGGIPFPFRTPPTWPCEDRNINTSYKDSIPKVPEPSQPHSQMHTPNPSTAQMPHAHQLPPHMQSQQGTPTHRPPFMPQPQHQHPHAYGPNMQQFGPNGSVQSSPRFQPPQMAFNGQMPGMPMPQFAGQQMQGYGMSPNMQYRQVNMPPQGPMMMMPSQQHQQMPIPQGYPRNHGQFNPQMMGGVPMANQHSAGGFMPPQQPQSFSPMPPHAQPQHQHHMQQHPHGGYQGSPRPHVMQQTASAQGYQPQYMGPSPGQHHPYQMQHRQMSAGGWTPRQQAAIPNMPMQPSPGMHGLGRDGDEGK
ncbi:poly(A)-binding protein binding protein [Vermiconidia calcicola]|uniref:Poly(A)-binding protein binding protein n=1 Tax=Vermiconidia calcicola TaxID=1690605 RepID=A0ACC3NV29_9PEZI|nr:poly(A)-binding protein binding protein [Vermiconidia calcicola]